MPNNTNPKVKGLIHNLTVQTNKWFSKERYKPVCSCGWSGDTHITAAGAKDNGRRHVEYEIARVRAASAQITTKVNGASIAATAAANPSFPLNIEDMMRRNLEPVMTYLKSERDSALEDQDNATRRLADEDNPLTPGEYDTLIGTLASAEDRLAMINVVESMLPKW